MPSRRIKQVFLAVFVGTLLGFAAQHVWADAKSSDTYKELSFFGDVFEKVRDNYVEPVGDDKLVEAAVNGMLTSLDPHSSYMNEKAYQDMQVQTKGEFGGLGMEVTQENGLVKVVSPIDDTPASRAGVKAGDLIVAIDDEPVMGLTLSEAVEKMRGEIGSQIKLLIKRGETAEPFELTLTREEIKLKSVKWDVKGNIGYIRLSTFNEQTQPGLDAAIADIKQRLGDKLQGYVLDLRNNPGGLLDQAVSVSGTFLDKGEIVSTRGRNPDDVQRFDVKGDGDETQGAPLVVLINGGSASASEIVAGALQDHGRAVIMGTQSFGKGSVQTIMQIPGHGAIRLTTARYYTPSGRSIQNKGITPDIEVKPAKLEETEQITGMRREADLKGALKNTDPDAAGSTVTTTTITKTVKPVDEAKPDDAKPVKPGSEATPTPTPTENQEKLGDEKVDYQLDRALDLLRGMSVFKTHDEKK